MFWRKESSKLFLWRGVILSKRGVVWGFESSLGSYHVLKVKNQSESDVSMSQGEVKVVTHGHYIGVVMVSVMVVVSCI